MTETLDFSKLTQKTNDLFELVVATAKRARQVNALRIAKYPLPTLTEDQEETFEETPDEEEIQNWDKVDKPATLALNEMLEGKLDYRYAEKVGREGEESAGEI